MKELKSKKTGRIHILNEEEYAAVVRKGVIDLKKFIVTDLKIRTIVPSMKEVIKPKSKKNEG
jgi:hypothetical protein